MVRISVARLADGESKSGGIGAETAGDMLRDFHGGLFPIEIWHRVPAIPAANKDPATAKPQVKYSKFVNTHFCAWCFRLP